MFASRLVLPANVVYDCGTDCHAVDPLMPSEDELSLLLPLSPLVNPPSQAVQYSHSLTLLNIYQHC